MLITLTNNDILFLDIVGGDDDDDDDDVPDLVENFDEASKNEANAKTSRVDDDDGAADDEDDEKSSPSALPTGIKILHLYLLNQFGSYISKRIIGIRYLIVKFCSQS